MAAGPGGELIIREVRGGPDLAIVRALCCDFLDWVRERYADRIWMVDTYYTPEKWMGLLKSLPEIHGPPHGAIYLAMLEDAPAGCVMLERFSDDICEMKRLFVPDHMRGKGVSRALCDALFQGASARGYRAMRLETGEPNREALALYEKLGFRAIAPYREFDSAMNEAIIFMEKPLD